MAGRYPTVIGQQPRDWRQYSQSMLRDLPSMSASAMQMQQGLQGPSAIDFAPDMYYRAMERQMEGPSMAERATAEQRIGQQFGSAVGNIASKGARAGFYSPGAVAQQAMRKPAASLANSLQQLEADRRKMLREGAAGVGRQLQAPMQSVVGRENRAARARGDIIGRYQRDEAQMQALRRTGAGGTRLGASGGGFWGGPGRVTY